MKNLINENRIKQNSNFMSRQLDPLNDSKNDLFPMKTTVNKCSLSSIPRDQINPLISFDLV